ncbi:MAG: HEAT repeat domain-containing protein [Bryobacterales bacterium]|nr:HEAT repeat domain-containing protein [Bryobacterales bacterium]
MRAFVWSAVVAAAIWTGGERAATQSGIQDVSIGSGERSLHLSAEPGRSYQLLVSASRLTAFGGQDAVLVTVRDGDRRIVRRLHAGDADLYVTVTPSSPAIEVTFAREHGSQPVPLSVDFSPLQSAASPDGQIASAFHTSWRHAEPIELGRTVFATADDRPYVPSPGPPAGTFDQMLAGVHWYRFDYAGPGETLLHLNVDILDRDVPLDLALFTAEDGKPVEYTRGRERYEQEKSTNFHGMQKFLPRVIAPGRYYVRVMGNHPTYQLRSSLYPAPPYDDARQAVRVAMDYLVRKGDSWHSNIPRKGSIVLRTSNPLQETRLCIACHPTHFTTRAELIAVENGYPVHARPNLQYLVERLYNNPRPIYGRTDASWARMIHAPGNVLSRLAYITNKYDELITGERRDELYRGIAAYLEMYWDGMAEPQPESNGNLPRISGYEIAMHSGLLFADLARRTGDGKWTRLREQTERVALAGEPVDMLDLAWKLDALLTLGDGKYRAETDKLVERIFSHQKPDGSWPMPFGMEEIQYDWRAREVIVKKLPQLPNSTGPRTSEFQSWHAIYVLARAGVTMDDPRMAKAVKLCLSRQTASGAWQGAPDYKNFDTPFRDTQYAVMALSTLFPGGTTAKGWNAGFPAPPVEFPADAAGAVAALDQHWDAPGEAAAARIRTLINSPRVLVRYQAAVALGRFADAASVEALAARLGDPSKIVQRAAAWSLRQIGSRQPAARAATIAAIRAALRSEDERTRWGAVRIFNQHFKYMAEEWDLGRELLRLARQEPAPAIRTGALQSLYQWWYWDRDPGHKDAIERTLTAALGDDAHPWVRRNAIEAYNLVLDDNLRYLYGSWIVRVKREEDRAAIGRGHKDNVRRQAERYRDAMAAGNRLAKDGLLRALYTHHVREGLGEIKPLEKAQVPETVAGSWVNGYRFAALYDPLKGGTGAAISIGNDSDPPAFYDDSTPIMNEAFLAALRDGDADLAVSTIRALKFLKSFDVSEPLADRLLALAAAAPVREELAANTGLLAAAPLRATRLKAMLESPESEIVAIAAALLAEPKQTAAASDGGIQQTVRGRLLALPVSDSLFPRFVDMLATMPALRQDAALARHLAAGLSAEHKAAREAVIRVVLRHPEMLDMEGVRTAWDRAMGSGDGVVLASALQAGGTLDYNAKARAGTVPVVRILLLAGLDHTKPPVRAQALSALRTIAPLQSDEAVTARRAALLRDPDRTVRNSALAFQASLDARAGAGGFSARDVLDYDYFKNFVEPILITRGHDGLACANCHANHNLFKLVEPDQYGQLTLQQSRSNFDAASRIVNVRDPENSLLLNKPTFSLDDAGIGDSREFSHGGGLRWIEKRNSREYRTVLRWIQGARVDDRPVESGGSR